MKKWEYMTIKLETKGLMGGKVDTMELDGMLEVYGRDGWELATSYVTLRGEGYSRDILCTFKRELK